MNMVYGVARENFKAGEMVHMDTTGGIWSSNSERRKVEDIAFGPPLHYTCKSHVAALERQELSMKMRKVDLLNAASVADFRRQEQEKEFHLAMRHRDEAHKKLCVQQEENHTLKQQVLNLKNAIKHLADAII